MSFEEFHNEVESTVGAADGVDLDDIGVVHLGGESGFVFEGQNAVFVVTIFFVEDLDGDFPAEERIPAHKDHAHAADGVAAFELVSAKLPFNARFSFAMRADCGLEGSKGGDVQKFSASLARLVGGSGFRMIGHKIGARRRLTSFQQASEHAGTFALARGIPGDG